MAYILPFAKITNGPFFPGTNFSMTIKNNLRAGIGFLFFLALLSSILGAFYIYQLTRNQKAILRDNYESLMFSKNIDKALDLPNIPVNIQQQIIEKNIRGELGNITETGEKAYADSLYSAFIRFRQSVADPVTHAIARAEMKVATYEIMEVNMQAIENRNRIADDRGNSAIWVVAIIDTIYVLIAFLFLIKFPAFITSPISELMDGIREVANKNYHKRLNFTVKDEFYELSQTFNQMAAKLFDYENSNLARIRYEKLRVETIVKNVTDAIIGFDERGIIVSVSPVAERLLGVQENELEGLYADVVARENDLFDRLINERDEQPDFKLYLDGKQSYFSKEIFEISAPDDGLFHTTKKNRVGYFILLKNITRFYQIDEAKTNFIATISHELKTPIGSLKMSLRMLEDERFGTINNFQRELIKNIDDDSERLLKITSELLDMGQVETGKLLLNFTPTEPHSIVRFANETVKLIAYQKQVSIKISCSKKLPEIWADPDKTTWVLINFLTNAIKYSRPNAIVELMVKKHSSKMIEFSVRDYGKGIEEMYLPRIFERYFKVPDSGTVSGTGLGLAIAKDFIEAQGGHIGAESRINEGSRFYFRLPLA